MAEYHSQAEKVAKEHLNKRKITLPEIPVEIPRIDFGTLPDVPSETLTSLMGRIAQWQDYLETEEALGYVNALAAKKEAKDESDKTLIRFRSQDRFASTKITELKSHVNLDGAVMAAHRTELEAVAVQRLLEGRVNGLEKLYAAVSRELTRRGHASDRNPDRSISWQRRKVE